jgi:hypothetical protein
MADQTSGTNEVVENQAPVDPWVAAFAALEQRGEGDGEKPSDSGSSDVSGGNVDNAEGANPSTDVSNAVENGDSVGDEAAVGGLDSHAGTDGSEDTESRGSAFTEALGVTEETIKQYEEKLSNDIRDKAITDVAQEFIKRGIRNRNGQLGATLDDPDICKRDEDGVPHFYNPETGREFTGDNPRRQAQEWVDDYNKELARVFNNSCEAYEETLKKDSAPQLAVMKFAPTYEKLDDISKGMFDNIVQNYEIADDNGKVIGYSCDLDKALDIVERQIGVIQNYAKQHQQQAAAKPAPTGPVLDMKTSSGAVPNGNDAPPTSLAEAMERLQDAQIAKLKKN